MLRFPLLFLCFFAFDGGEGTTFKFVNKCEETVWPGILSNAGSPLLQLTGFELAVGASLSVHAPSGWSGRLWARTGCPAARSNGGRAWSCATGDCGSGRVECNGSGATPPVTLAEFALSSTSSVEDFYDVSLVDGYNLPVLVEASRPGCATAGCAVDLSQRCPTELRAAEQPGVCRSACDAFRKPEYCCSGAFANPATCRPTAYSELFKASCPKSYSYAFDDPTSTFTCAGGADYDITFCPDSASSSRSWRDGPSSSSSSTNATSNSMATSRPAAGGVMLADEAWLASMATSDAAPLEGPPSISCYSLMVTAMACIGQGLLL